MGRRLRRILVCAVVPGGMAAVVAALLAGGSVAAPASSACRWSLVTKAVRVGSTIRRVGFLSVAATSRSNVWAGGIYEPIAKDPFVGSPVLERWDGRRWRSVPLPGVLPQTPITLPTLGSVRSVAASGKDVWAVGVIGKRGFAGHWHGTRLVGLTHPGGANMKPTAVAAVSPTDVWVIGDDGGEAVVLRWNGARWAAVAPPPLGTGGELKALAAIPGTSQVWLAGWTEPDENGLAARWNGSGWDTYRVGTPTGTSSKLGAASAAVAWIVEYTRSYSWNGTGWSASPVSIPGLTTGVAAGLVAVAGSSAQDAWGVGDYTLDKKTWHSLIEHWDGSAWTRVAVPVSPPLWAVTTVPGTHDVWAVGGAVLRLRC